MNSAYDLIDVKYGYDGLEALNIDQCQIHANKTTAILGPNGAGKSTLLNILAFVFRVSSGEVKFFNKRCEHESHSALRRRVAYVQQNPYLFNDTVIKNVELGLKLRGVNKKDRHQSTMIMLERLGLGDLAPRRAHELSGGETQKVAIARAMVLETEVILLDEPFTYLDKRFAKDLEQLILDNRRTGNQTVIFSTHDQSRAQVLADDIFSMLAGRYVPSSIVNLYSGRLLPDKNIFETAELKISVPENLTAGEHIAIESTQIVLSKEQLLSSMRNSFRGKIRSLHEDNGQIQVTIEAGEIFQIIITKAALDEMNINVGEMVWLSFKSSAISVF
ncbi:MAG: ABC transporter ATP-binding protein [Gammaproteobacteria bacterium]|nr:MAG: ABC transporter ATP-binding protein [Gammaproteobacteria bacterium]